MIKIIIDNPFDKDIFEAFPESCYSLNSVIEITDDADLEAATAAWFKAMQVAGYPMANIKKMAEKLDITEYL